MQLDKVSFVGADFETGQSHKGLADSSTAFLNYLIKRSSFSHFEVIKQVKSLIVDEAIHCFSELDLFRLDLKKYEELCEASLVGLNANGVCLNFGGDHSVAISTIEASLRKNTSTHVIWIDAHADANSLEESLSGNFHGMPVYYLLKKQFERPLLLQWMQKTLRPEQLTYIGLRDLDAFEVRLLEKSKIQFFTAQQVQEFGLDFILEFIAKKNRIYEKIHVSFDIDSLDPEYGLCTGVPVRNGLNPSDVMKIFELVRDSGKLSNVDFVEINPRMAKSATELESVYDIAFYLIRTLFKIKTELTEDHNAFIHH